MGSAPRLRATGGHSVRRRQVCNVLIAVVDRKQPFVLAANLLLELGLEVVADDEHNLAKSSTDGIEHGIVKYGFAAGTNRINLL